LKYSSRGLHCCYAVNRYVENELTAVRQTLEVRATELQQRAEAAEAKVAALIKVIANATEYTTT
jgi:hypothetical protein